MALLASQLIFLLVCHAWAGCVIDPQHVKFRGHAGINCGPGLFAWPWQNRNVYPRTRNASRARELNFLIVPGWERTSFEYQLKNRLTG
uniref:Putative secreted protein n=1 Tax=Ixodes ricinus TaxID=34613 RepID=A0A6B0U5Z1_IXORI